jgi:hypothetical protein
MAGILLRAYLVLVVYVPSENIYSDIAGYTTIAGRLLSPGYSFDAYDLIQPLGTSALLAAIMKVSGGLELANWIWLLLSSMVPFLWFYVAFRLAGIRVAAAVAWLTALDVSHASSASLLMSETPFSFLVASGFACFVTALQTSGKRSRNFAAGAGILWGSGMLFRGHALAILFMLACGAGYFAIMRRQKYPVLVSLISFLAVLALSSVYFSVKTGRPMMTSLGIASQTLMGRLPDSAEARFEAPGTNIWHVYGNPASHQRGPTNKFAFPFAVIDNESAIRETVRIFNQDPVRFLALSVRNANDSFFGNDPWPTNQMPSKHWLRLFECVFTLFFMVPALAIVFPRYPRGVPGLAISAMVLTLAGVWLIGLVTIGEARYRIPFDGLIAILAIFKLDELFVARRDVK